MTALEIALLAATGSNLLALGLLAFLGAPRRIVTRCIELTDRVAGMHSRVDRIEAQRASVLVEHEKMTDELETLLGNIERKRNAATTAAGRLDKKELKDAQVEEDQAGSREAQLRGARQHFYGH